MVYRRVPQCRICTSTVVDKIDKDLLNKVSPSNVVKTYAQFFTPEAPLTKACIRGHWRHFKSAVDTVAVARAQVLPSVPTLSQANIPHDPTSQQVFEAAVQEKVNEIEIMDKLIQSGLADLNALAPQPGENEFRILNRDRIRRSTAMTVMDSAKVKQMALQAEEDRHRMEKGRVIFRMFQLFSRALEACPVEHRSIIASQLKEVIRDDDEINQLLKEQAARPAVSSPDKDGE